jgi:hypothetical protein
MYEYVHDDVVAKEQFVLHVCSTLLRSNLYGMR